MPQPSPYQFSLREMLLLITAIGASLALVLQNVQNWAPLHGTGLTRDFSLQSSVKQIASSQGLGGAVSGSGGGGASSGPESREVSFSYGFRIPKKDRLAVYTALRGQIEKLLAESECRIDGGGSGSRSFHSRYQNDSLRGIVKVEMRDDSTDLEYVHISYFAVEFKK